MGKKRQPNGYDKQALQKLALKIRNFRRPIRDGGFPKVNAKLEKLEETIRNLPKKEREIMEKFWGLIPGTADLSQGLYVRKDVAYKNMISATEEVIVKLLSIEYLYRYDDKVRELVKNLNRKINKAGAEEVSDIDAVKYIMIYLIYFMDGPKMISGVEIGGKIDLEYEAKGQFDDYALLNVVWDKSANLLEDSSIRLKLLIDMLYMFDLKDVVSMKKAVGLAVTKAEADIETERLVSFKEIRLFKERIFHYGVWQITGDIIAPEANSKIDLKEFESHFSEFREDWSSVERFRKPKKFNQKIMTSKGERDLVTYEIGGLTFTDIYEVMFLYVSRNML